MTKPKRDWFVIPDNWKKKKQNSQQKLNLKQARRKAEVKSAKPKTETDVRLMLKKSGMTESEIDRFISDLKRKGQWRY